MSRKRFTIQEKARLQGFAICPDAKLIIELKTSHTQSLSILYDLKDSCHSRR